MGRNSRSDSDRGRSLFSRGLYRYYYYSVVNQRERERERASILCSCGGKPCTCFTKLVLEHGNFGGKLVSRRGRQRKEELLNT